MEEEFKPFNLQRALAGHPVILRNGWELIRIVHMPELSDSQRVIVVAKSPLDGECRLFTYYDSGSMFVGQKNEFDLFMKAVEKEYWTASGRGDAYPRHFLCTRLCETKEDIERLVKGTGLNPDTIQFHKVTRIE